MSKVDQYTYNSVEYNNYYARTYTHFAWGFWALAAVAAGLFVWFEVTGFRQFGHTPLLLLPLIHLAIAAWMISEALDSQATAKSFRERTPGGWDNW